jgi:cytochrome c oxidase cbb3-type subunit 2
VVGVPYTAEQITNAKKDLEEQASSDASDAAIAKRYPKAKMGDADGNAKVVTEMDALVAYLQVLGTMVDFTTVKPEAIRR